MEILEEAFGKGELMQFLMGRGAYFVRDRDWGGHDYSYTNMIIERYLKSTDSMIDKNIFFELVDNEYISILKKKDLNIQEYVCILGFIKLYFIWKIDEGFDINWEISNKLKNELLILKPYFETQDSIFTPQIDGNLKILKERYGFNLD